MQWSLLLVVSFLFVWVLWRYELTNKILLQGLHMIFKLLKQYYVAKIFGQYDIIEIVWAILMTGLDTWPRYCPTCAVPHFCFMYCSIAMEVTWQTIFITKALSVKTRSLCSWHRSVGVRFPAVHKSHAETWRWLKHIFAAQIEMLTHIR